MPPPEAAVRSDGRRAARAHDELVTALYGGELEQLDGARLLYNRHIEEPEWSHAGALAVDEAARPERLASSGVLPPAAPRGVVTDPWTAPASLPGSSRAAADRGVRTAVSSS
jgi:hypothetical protein